MSQLIPTLTCCRSCATFFLAVRALRLVARHLALDIMVAEGGEKGVRLPMSTWGSRLG